MSTRSRHGPPLIGALLRMPWEHVLERLLAGLRERGFADLGAAHLTVLQWPGPDDLRPSELAARTGMSKQALNYLLGQLETRGYLERRDDPGDLRTRRVYLTERGEATRAVIRDAVREVEAEWAAKLGAEELERLRTLLTGLTRIVQNEHDRT
jgi:DNA-binding MarR family transcriptional regulator